MNPIVVTRWGACMMGNADLSKWIRVVMSSYGKSCVHSSGKSTALKRSSCNEGPMSALPVLFLMCHSFPHWIHLWASFSYNIRFKLLFLIVCVISLPTTSWLSPTLIPSYCTLLKEHRKHWEEINLCLKNVQLFTQFKALTIFVVVTVLISITIQFYNKLTMVCS